jgi:hypothetical protein
VLRITSKLRLLLHSRRRTGMPDSAGRRLGGDPNNPARFKDNATADELREEIMRRRAALNESGILDLERLITPEAGIAYQPMSGVRTDRDCIHR